MKLVQMGLLAGLLGAFVACSEEEAPAPAPAEPVAAPAPAEAAPAPAAKPEPTALDACNEFAAAAKAPDEAKITAMLAAGGAEAMAGEGVKEAMMAVWTTRACGEMKAEADKATVALTAEGKEAVEAAFVKADGAWKFDLVSYLAKHPVEMAKGKKGKKGKKAGGKKHK